VSASKVRSRKGPTTEGCYEPDARVGPFDGEELCHGGSHEIALAVVHEQVVTFGSPTFRQRIGGQDVSCACAVERLMREMAHTVLGPVSTGRHDDDLGFPVENIAAAERRAHNHFDGVELRELPVAVGDEPSPLSEARKLRDPGHMTSDGRAALNEHDLTHACVGQRDRALHARHARPDHDHLAIAPPGLRDALGVPVAAILLARRRILGACEAVARRDARNAEVSADAFPNVGVAPYPDLRRQKWICDRRASAADQVEGARTDHLDHQIGM